MLKETNKNLAKDIVFEFETALGGKKPDSEGWIYLYEMIVEEVDKKDITPPSSPLPHY